MLKMKMTKIGVKWDTNKMHLYLLVIKLQANNQRCFFQQLRINFLCKLLGLDVFLVFRNAVNSICIK